MEATTISGPLLACDGARGERSGAERGRETSPCRKGEGKGEGEGKERGGRGRGEGKEEGQPSKGRGTPSPAREANWKGAGRTRGANSALRNEFLIKEGKESRGHLWTLQTFSLRIVKFLIILQYVPYVLPYTNEFLTKKERKVAGTCGHFRHSL